jgi:hypothetical protein
VLHWFAGVQYKKPCFLWAKHLNNFIVGLLDTLSKPMFCLCYQTFCSLLGGDYVRLAYT